MPAPTKTAPSITAPPLADWSALEVALEAWLNETPNGQTLSRRTQWLARDTSTGGHAISPTLLRHAWHALGEELTADVRKFKANRWQFPLVTLVNGLGALVFVADDLKALWQRLRLATHGTTAHATEEFDDGENFSRRMFLGICGVGFVGHGYGIYTNPTSLQAAETLLAQHQNLTPLVQGRLHTAAALELTPPASAELQPACPQPWLSRLFVLAANETEAKLRAPTAPNGNGPARLPAPATARA